MKRDRQRLAWMLSLAGVGILASSGCQDKSDSSSSSPAPAESPADADVSGFGGRITGQLAVTQGAPADSISAANLSVQDRPEVEAVSAGDGSFTIDEVAPGVLTVYGLSSDGNALTTMAGASYGIKLDEIVVRAGEITDVGQQEMARTGAISGTVDFFENPNNVDKAGSDIFVPGTSFIAKSGNQGEFTLDGLPAGTYQLRFQHTGFSVSTLADVIVASGETTTLDPVLLSLSTGPEGTMAIDADLTPTKNGSTIKVETTRSVSINLSYDSDAVLMKVSDEPSFLNRSWEAVAKTYAWTFDSDGLKTLYVQFSDLNGLESSPYSDEIYIDTEAPTLTSISILNGWAETANENVTIAATSSDTGSGVHRIMFRNTDSSFGSGDSWVDHASELDWTLVSGAGAKAVYAKVIDYAGRESSTVSSSINIGTHTLIANATYSSKVTLKKKHSPYLISNDLTFSGGMEIEPGVSLTIGDGQTVSVTGVFTAQGTDAGSGQITIRKESLSSGMCYMDGQPKIRFDLAAHGVTNSNRVSYVHFNGIQTIAANGGVFKNNIFETSNCSTYGGEIRKAGTDIVSITDNTFTAWGTGVTVTTGDGNTTFSGNSGAMMRLARQEGTATNTTLTNNNVAYNNTTQPTGWPNTPGFVEWANGGTYTMSGNTIDAAGATAFAVQDGHETDVTISNTYVTGCESMAILERDTDDTVNLTIENSTFEDCNYGLYGWTANAWDDGTILFDHNTIQVNTALVTGNLHSISHNFTYNDITCSNGGTCDLFLGYEETAAANPSGTGTLTMSNNNITCAAGQCRGFTIQAGDGDAHAVTLTLSINGNYWGAGKALETNLLTNLQETDSGSPTVSGTNVSSYEYYTGGTEDITTTSWPNGLTVLGSAVSGAGDPTPP